MDAGAEQDLPFGRQTDIALNHAILHFDGAANRVNDAAELDENAIACTFDHTAMVNGDGGIDEVGAKATETRDRALLIGRGKAAIANNIGSRIAASLRFRSYLVVPYSMQRGWS